MKKTLLTMATALVLVGCSESESFEMPPGQGQNTIAFDTYLGDNATRASIVTTETLGVDGFGVNAYYTGTTPFAQGAELNFMQNTKVNYNKDTRKWEYSPVKYWPNNEGDMVSFFAYAPYAKNPGDNNITQTGTDIGFAVASDVKNQVDLVYNTNYAGTINQHKPAVDECIHFQFGHALSRISFTIEAAVDEVANGNNLLDGNTRINVKKVALVADKDTDPLNPTGPFYTDGTLSLLEADKENPWTAKSGAQGFVLNAKDHFYHTVKDIDAESEQEIDVAQLSRFNADKPQRLLNDDSYLMVIPQETSFKIYIEYDVISGGYENNGSGTYDESAITNKITSAEAISVNLEKGKAYNFNLVLGMTGVKVDAEVDEWEDEIDGGDIWLPENEEPIDPNKTVFYNASEKLNFTNSKAFGGNEVLSHTFSNGMGAIICKDDITKIAFPDDSFVGFGDATNPEVVTNLILPSSLKEIGRFAFTGMNFTSIIIPEGVTTIGEGAFVGCENLSRIDIPNSVTVMGDQVFFGCKNLKAVSLPNNANYNTIGANMFRYCDNLKELTIPENITSLLSDALACPLQTLTINYSEGVVSPYVGAISILFGYNNAADADKITTEIYVPDELVELYKGDSLWGQIKSQIKGISEKE